MTSPEAPSLADIEEMANRALDAIPQRFKRHLGAVVIRIEDFPDEATLRAMGLASPFDILGLYRGVAVPHKSVSDPRPHVDMIYLYRRPILAYWQRTGEDLVQLVRHVLIHEIGHHFGFSDATWPGSRRPPERRAAIGAQHQPQLSDATARLRAAARQPSLAAASEGWWPYPDSNRDALRLAIFVPLRLSPPPQGSWSGLSLRHHGRWPP